MDKDARLTEIAKLLEELKTEFNIIATEVDHFERVHILWGESYRDEAIKNPDEYDCDIETIENMTHEEYVENYQNRGWWPSSNCF